EVLCLQGVHAGNKDVSDLAFGDEDSRLSFADGELGPVLDFVLIPRESVAEDVVIGWLGPLDDVDELAAQLVEQAHERSPKRRRGCGGLFCSGRGSFAMGPQTTLRFAPRRTRTHNSTEELV